MLKEPACVALLALMNPWEAEVVDPDPSDLSEWASCISATRYYVALNETLGEAELADFVLDWLEEIEAQRLVRNLDLILAEDLPWVYRAWRLAMTELHDDGMSWIEYVRVSHPAPVVGFHWIGRDANESRRYRPGEVSFYRYHGGDEE